jgi:hypothetical protein
MAKNETINSTDNHSDEQNLQNSYEIKYLNNDYDENNLNYPFNYFINNKDILDVLSDNNSQEFNFELPYSETERAELEKKEKNYIIKKEKNEKKKKKLVKKKRYKSKENSENKEIYPKKMFNTYIEKENQIKIGNNTERKSKRESNQLAMIKRNLIQNILLYWINYGKTDKTKRLRKLNPIIFLCDDFKKKTLQEIYSQKITEKELDKNHNKNIIKNAIGITKMKLCLGFKDALKFFFNEYFEEKELLQIFQNLKENNDVSEEISYKGFIKGLKGAKEYLKEKGGNEVYSKKFENSLKKFREKYLL